MRGITTRTTGLVIFILGLWGGLIPFVGPYFNYALGPDHAWKWTTGRLWLDILPGVAAVLGGLMLMSAGPRPHARLGALLALAGGIWFVIGPEISQLWATGGAQGAGHGGAHRQMLEMLGFHTGLGVIVAALAGYALPRFVLPATAMAAEPVAAREGYGAEEESGRAGRTGRRHHVARDAAVAGGAAVAADVAIRHHERREAERGAGDEAGYGADPAREREGGARERDAGALERDAGAPVAGAGAGSGARAGSAVPEGEPMTQTAEPVADEQALPAGEAPNAAGGPAGEGEPVGERPLSGRGQMYSEYGGGVRRRRRGLLSVFSRH
jgi:hypothetical protein